MHHTGNIDLVRMSPSSRRAWIEIWPLPVRLVCLTVALLAEGVDRNHALCSMVTPWAWSPSSRRAWIEIQKPKRHATNARRSPSSRRAWIEIYGAPRLARGILSPSSRRAWIEITL